MESGTYVENIDFLGKAITVRSVDPNNPKIAAETIIDCQGSEEQPHRGFYIHSNEDSNSVIAGLTIINGYDGYAYSGAGVYCEGSLLSVRNCNFYKNTLLK